MLNYQTMFFQEKIRLIYKILLNSTKYIKSINYDEFMKKHKIRKFLNFEFLKI